MSERIGPVALSAPSTFLERYAAPTGDRRRSLLRRTRRQATAAAAEEPAKAALEERGERFDRLADVLLERETVEGAELRELLERELPAEDTVDCAPIGARPAPSQALAVVPAPRSPAAGDG